MQGRDGKISARRERAVPVRERAYKILSVIRSAFFKKEAASRASRYIFYTPTKLSLVLATAASVAGFSGLACLIVTALSSMGVNLGLEVSVLQGAGILSNFYFDLFLAVLACAVFCGNIRFQRAPGDESEDVEHMRTLFSQQIRYKMRDPQVRIVMEKDVQSKMASVLRCCNNVFEIDNNIYGPSLSPWTLEHYITDVMEVMSLGRITRSPIPKELAVASSGDFPPDREEELHGAIDVAREQVSGLAAIWASEYGLAGARLMAPWKQDREKVRALGEKMGLGAFVDTYLDGVPLEDVLA